MTTAVTAAQIAQVRRMTNEPLTTTYSDALITTIIEAYPTLDENGEAPRIHAADSARPVTYTAYMDVLDLIANQDWIPTYDLNAAAAQIWEEKAGTVSVDFDYSADGGNYSRSQVYDAYIRQAKYYSARRKIGTKTMKPEPHRRNMGAV